MKKKDFLYMFILLVTVSILVALLVPDNRIFGNSIDWFNQHVMLSDALRHAMNKEGTLFPTYMSELMGGVNIYYFSYYGYLRPDVILGALFIHINMIDIIVGYSIFLMILTSISCYLFLRHQNENKELCLFVSILVILSTVFFQSHKQIMFVNYMPFLFLALLSIDYYLEKKRLTPFVICGTLIMIHSYFYSIGCYLICLIYFVYKSYLNKQLTKTNLLSLFKGFILIALITAVLTIPTLYVIISNKKSVSPINLFTLFNISIDLKALLYDNYGCGFTYLTWILLILGLNYKKTRILSMITILSMILPLISYLFNGFLYARSKILIVFIPIIAYIICEVMDQIINHEIKWNYFSIILMIIPAFFMKNLLIVCIDIIVCILIFLTRKYNRQSYFIYLSIPLLIVCINNPATSFLKKKTYQSVMDNDKTALIERNENNMIRLGDFENQQTVNDTFNSTVSKASGYTSTNHTLYNQFLYDTLHLPISINNRVANKDDAHPFYLGMMSINTIITKNKKSVGYQLVDKQKNHLLYQNENVMPQAYASKQLYSEKALNKLAFPQKLDTLYNNVVVQNGQNNYQSQFINEDLGFNQTYHIQNNKKTSFTKNIQRTSQNEILVIEFDIKNNNPKKFIEITINGIKNKLSASNATYYNDNTHFTYVLSDEKAIEQLQITLSKGDYQISHITCSSLPYKAIKNRCHEVDAMHIKKGNDVLNGDIDVSDDGYFVTNIPFDNGYTIYIDNQKVKTEIVNTAFLGCPIQSGHHQIKITFQPKGYQLGLKMSFIGIVLTLFNLIHERKKKNER